MGKAKLLQHTHHRYMSGAVQRSVDDADAVSHLFDHFRMKDRLLYLCNVGIVHFLSDGDVKACCLCFFFGHGFASGHIRDRKHMLRYSLVMRRSELGAVLPVDLVAVISGGIVACCYIDAGDASEIPYRKGKLGRGSQGLEAIGLDSVRCKGTCSFVRKLDRHMAGVIGDRNALILSALLNDIIRKALCSSPDHILVHPVGTGTDDAPKSCRTELKIHMEALHDLFIVALNGSQFLPGLLIIIGIAEPLVVNCLVVSHGTVLVSSGLKGVKIVSLLLSVTSPVYGRSSRSGT